MRNRNRSLVLLAAGIVTAVAWADGGARTQYLPGQVIYAFNPGGNTCYPDNWTFFGYPQTDFGFTAEAEDGGGAFQAADWTGCDLEGLPQCVWVGSAVGIGPFAHPQCTPGGVSDANLDLSLGTGLTVRIQDKITSGMGGTLGSRLQVEMVDNDGTTAVISRNVPLNPAVNRPFPLTDSWQTYTIFFVSLDAFWDNDSSVAGTVPGLNLTHIKEIKFIWRRYTAEGVNVYQFDNIALTDATPLPWADRNADGDVDLADFAEFQGAFAAAPTPATAKLDANYDGAIDLSDWKVWKDCILGPDVNGGFYPWAY